MYGVLVECYGYFPVAYNSNPSPARSETWKPPTVGIRAIIRPRFYRRSAELFEVANDQLAERLAIDPEPETLGNGNHRLERLTAPAGKGKRS